jgi:nucleoid DNA-binding protein
MAKNKTTENESSITDFINTVTDDIKRNDSLRLVKLIEETTLLKAKMWGTAIIGFGSYHYKYESGREGDAPLVGFSPRKEAIALYLSSQFKDRAELLTKFGKHKTGKACIYIKKLDDVNINVLQEMVSNSLNYIKKKYN